MNSGPGWRSLRPGGDEGIGKQVKLEGRCWARPCWTRSAVGSCSVFYLWTAGELPKGLGERLEQVAVESRSLCLLVRGGWWGRRHSRRLGRGCGKVQVGDGGVKEVVELEREDR